MATANPTAKPVKSKTDQSIDYMRAEGVTAYAAGKVYEISPSAIYRRLAQLKAMHGHPCPCCGQIIKA
jgi:hypothetical protein